jgi:peptidoglycan/xylan/chitin deacetylase (PgdA/CDA1 family)
VRMALKRSLAWGLLRSGLLSLHRAAVERGRAVILLYHRVNDEGDPFFPALPVKDFVAQLEHVARHYRVEPLESVLDWLEEGATGRVRVVITIDDGYPDTHDVVLPTLERLGLPATLFLCTGPPETGTLVWSDRVRAILEHARGRALALPALGLDLPTDSREARLAACARLLPRLKQMGPAAIAEGLARLEEQLDPRPRTPRVLGWDEVRRLSRGPIAMGAHTHNHYMLSRLDEAEARAEVAASLDLIEARVGLRPRTFAYPNGQAGDYDARSVETLRALGLRCALSSRHGLVGPRPDPWEIPRLYTTETSLPLFAARTSGLSLARRAGPGPAGRAEVQ